MNLKIEQIILLSYLTKYNVKAIKEYPKKYEDYDNVLGAIIADFAISDKGFREAVQNTNLAIEKIYFYSLDVLTIYDDKYPSSLRAISDAPPIIFYRGILKTPTMAAVVGSRKVSKFGKKITYEVVDWLHELGYGVVSGLALGIDTFAHERAVQNNQYTIAVLPNSLDSIYPVENFKLANNIMESGGCILSELVFGINRGNQSFVQRNRLQAALSQFVIPIEMGVKSGTMHTINFAKRYKKAVALFKPTPMLSQIENFYGINHLIDNPVPDQIVFTDKISFLDSISNSINK